MDVDRGKGKARGGGRRRSRKGPQEQGNFDETVPTPNASGYNPFLHPEQNVGDTMWSNQEPRYEGLTSQPSKGLHHPFDCGDRTDRNPNTFNSVGQGRGAGRGGKRNNQQKNQQNPSQTPFQCPQFTPAPFPPQQPPQNNQQKNQQNPSQTPFQNPQFTPAPFPPQQPPQNNQQKNQQNPSQTPFQYPQFAPAPFPPQQPPQFPPPSFPPQQHPQFSPPSFPPQFSPPSFPPHQHPHFNHQVNPNANRTTQMNTHERRGNYNNTGPNRQPRGNPIGPHNIPSPPHGFQRPSFQQNYNMHPDRAQFPPNMPTVSRPQFVQEPLGMSPGSEMARDHVWNPETNLHRVNSVGSLNSERSFNSNKDRSAKEFFKNRNKNRQRKKNNVPQNDLSNDPLHVNNFNTVGESRPLSRNSSVSDRTNDVENQDFVRTSNVDANRDNPNFRGRGRGRGSTRARGSSGFTGSNTMDNDRPLSRSSSVSYDPTNDFANLHLSSEAGFTKKRANNRNKNGRGRGKEHRGRGNSRPLSRQSTYSNDENTNLEIDISDSVLESECNKILLGQDSSSGVGKQGGGKSKKNKKNKTQNLTADQKSYINVEQVEKLKSYDPMELLEILSDEKNEYSSLLQEDLEPKIFISVVDLLSKICDTPSSQKKAEILRQASMPVFTNQLFNCVVEYPSLEDDDMLQHVNRFFENAISLYETLSDFMPSAVRMWHTHIGELLKSLNKMPNNPKIELNKYLLNMAKSLLDEVGQNLKGGVKEVKKQEEKKKKETYFPEPVGNFRTVSLYPRPEDIYAEQPFLYPNVINGPYRSIEHYLDIHFKLLREDFMSPIRQAMRDYKKQCKTKDKFKRIDNVRIYRKVKFLHPKTVLDTVGYEICFDVDNKLNRVNWEFSNRFMYGSLLLFTNDDFDTFFMATVANRNVKELERKLVTVELVERLDNVKSILGKEFVMAESEAYFNPYFHVLKALQRFDETNFPLAQYIVHVNTFTQPPRYLNYAEIYSITMAGNNFTFRVLSDNEWPSNEQLGLDSSQYNAFKAALTNDLTVIQGPPGTGKTFLGLKIAHALLQNAHVWNTTNTPIFVVCFTNHALDQFLEGLLPVTTKLVRIGGKSKGGELDKFNIRERRREYSYYKKAQGREIRDLKLKMSTAFADIQVYQTDLKLLENTIGVVSKNTLQYVMSEEQSNYFIGDDDFMDWLLEGVAGAKKKEKVKITITADRGVVTEAPTVDPLIADTEDIRIKQAFFDTVDLDTSVGPSEGTVKVQFACDLDGLMKKRDGLTQQLNGKIKLHKTQLLQMKSTCESLDVVISHLRKELHSESKKYPRSDLERETLLQQTYLRQLSPDDRWKLYHIWVNILRDGLMVTLNQKESEYKDYSFRYEQLRQNDDLQILKTSNVVGTTTTLAAKFQPMFEALAPKIVIVEEAAEVLEAHIIASLSRSCQHLILIGDHKQLRPSVAETRMARQYQLDVSLFERLVRNDMACHTLTLQHRMRPEISRQLVPTIYPQLRDDTSVLNRDDIRGMDKNVFFMTHNSFEDEVTEITSKRNRFEAEILLGLAKYLVQQGYKAQDITILATYKGQMYHMKNEIKNLSGFPKGIQITVVDNFQGEENKIILLSLVRSNAVKKIGFLEIENRICVALSRARDGLYIVGNMNCLVANSEIWVKIRNSLAQQNCYGPALNLRCQIHKEQVTKIETAKDFSKVSEGGCSLLCGQPLPCGHSCKSMCHVEQDYHQRYKCKETCTRILCAEGHQCPKKCHQPCGDCQIPMRRQLTCGHHANVPCHMDVREFKCIEPVKVEVPFCHHKIMVPCHSRFYPECNLPCTKRLECGHSCELTCHEADDPDHLEYACMKPCARLNKNCSKDHKCAMACFEECKPCMEMVIRQLPCGHSLKVACSVDVATIVCKQKCQKTMDCGHPCTKKCFQDCQPCEVQVKKKVVGCGHEVEVSCTTRAVRQLCTGSCTNILGCGHKCRKRCMDPCSTDDCEEPVHVKEKRKFSLFPASLSLGKKLYPMMCGHSVAHVPCNKVDQVERMSPEELMQYCSEPCGTELMCKHVCGGTCSQCMQGRIHKVCNEQCGNVLICGHSCKVPCREVCPPCKEPCRHECKHSKCNRKCGEECVPCKEPCDYACEHKQCTRRCGELCDRDPCYEPCRKRLSCGHDCVGYCGEPCPPCRKCEPHHFEEIFFTGEETEEDAKWVLLTDCSHTLESTGLEMWLNMVQESGEIGCKVCPRCKTPIVKVQRFMNLIKQTYLDIQRVKAQCFGKRDEIVKTRAQALRKIQNVEVMNLPGGGPDELIKMFEELKVELPEVKGNRKNTVDIQRLRLLCFWTEFFVSVYSRKRDVWPLLDDVSRTKLNSNINTLTRLLMKRRQKISEQEMQGFEREVKRIHRIADLLTYLSSPEYKMASSAAKELRLEAEKVIFCIQSYSDTIDGLAKEILVKLKQKIKSSTELSAEERSMIHQAMSSSFRSSQKTGHWFKCKNGHLYCITECGGAMEEARCPEPGCRELIGGRQHRLREGQSLATEMDGARHAAWSDANNMANFGLF